MEPIRTAHRRALVGGSAALPLVTVGLSLVHVPSWLSLSLVGCLLITIFVLAMRRLQVDSWTIAIQLSALTCYVIYFSYTAPDERTPDAIAQMRYIAYLHKHSALPPISECVVCHHPPLYYILAAGTSRLNELTQLVPGQRGLQALSLLLTAAYLAHVPLLLRRFTSSLLTIRLGTAMVGFWPSTVMQSCRIHNDSLANVVILVGVYWLIRWYRDDGARDLALAATFSSLSIMVKSSGYILVGTLSCLFFWRVLAAIRKRSLNIRRLWPVAILLLGVLATQALDRSAADSTACQRMFGRACAIRWTRLPNDFSTYAYFDVKSFVSSPYLVVGRRNTEHKYFLNCVVKSSLFGMQNSQPDAETARGFNPKIAGALNCVLLAMLAYGALTFFAAARTWSKRHAPQLIYLAMAIALMVAFRYIVPNPHHSDFRHIQPVLVLGVLFFVDAIEWHRAQRPMLAYLGVGLAVIMAMGSVIYWIPK